jgi:hypothetical protein
LVCCGRLRRRIFCHANSCRMAPGRRSRKIGPNSFLRDAARPCPLMALSGHQLVRCTCLLLTQSGHWHLQERRLPRYDVQGGGRRRPHETARFHGPSCRRYGDVAVAYLCATITKNTPNWRPSPGRTGIVVAPHEGIPRWIKRPRVRGGKDDCD